MRATARRRDTRSGSGAGTTVRIGVRGERRAARNVACWIAIATAVLPVAAATAVGAPAAPASDAKPAQGPVVVLAAEDDAAPWSYADGGGYVNDLVRAAFAESGWRVQLKVVPYARCKAMAVQGSVAGCFTVGRTAEGERSLLFPQSPVLQTRNVLVARAEAGGARAWSGCHPADWKLAPRVGLVRGYEYVPAVDALFRATPAAAEAEYADSEVSNLRKLRAGRIDATVVTLDEVKQLAWLARLAGVPTDMRTVCDYGALASHVAFSRRHPQGETARAAFDEGIARLMRRGAVAALQATWRQRALDAASAKSH